MHQLVLVTKVALEFISDVDIYSFFKKFKRGVASYISKISSKANKKYLKSYNPKQESTQSKSLKRYAEFNTQTKIETQKNGEKGYS